MLQRTGQNLTTQAITARQTLENKTNELLALQVKTQTALNTSALQNPQHHTTFPGQDNN
ncbi:MAG: hypothetical protein R3D66_00910 [Alphaproteobacteria bacterium]